MGPGEGFLKEGGAEVRSELTGTSWLHSGASCHHFPLPTSLSHQLEGGGGPANNVPGRGGASGVQGSENCDSRRGRGQRKVTQQGGVSGEGHRGGNITKRNPSYQSEQHFLFLHALNWSQKAIFAAESDPSKYELSGVEDP